MHLRRALLLFAIVLGLAAVAASVSRPRDDPEPPARTTPAPTVAPGREEEPSPDRVELYFDASDPKAHRMRAGEAATVYVAVPQAGQVEIADLGMSSTAEPLTAARFEVLTSQAGRFPITFVAAGAEEPSDAGTLVIRE